MEMNITSAQYTSSEGQTNYAIKAVIDGDTVFVPINEGNRHYQAILEWAKDGGNSIQDAE